MKKLVLIFNVILTIIAIWFTAVLIGGSTASGKSPVGDIIDASADDGAAGSSSTGSAPPDLPRSVATAIWRENLFSPDRDYTDPDSELSGDNPEASPVKPGKAAPEEYELVGVSSFGGKRRVLIVINVSTVIIAPKSKTLRGRRSRPTHPAKASIESTTDVFSIGDSIGGIGYKVVEISLDAVMLKRDQGAPLELELTLNRDDDASQKRHAARAKAAASKRRTIKRPVRRTTPTSRTNTNARRNTTNTRTSGVRPSARTAIKGNPSISTSFGSTDTRRSWRSRTSSGAPVAPATETAKPPPPAKAKLTKKEVEETFGPVPLPPPPPAMP